LFGLSIFLLPSIYNMAIAGRARCDSSLCLAEGKDCRAFLHSLRFTE
jgi:hypothetical protein